MLEPIDLTGLAPPLALLLGAGTAALLARWRRDDLAGVAVALASVTALLTLLLGGAGPGRDAPVLAWLGSATPISGDDRYLAIGQPLAGALLLGVICLAAYRVLAGRPVPEERLGGALAATALAGGAAVGALLAPTLPLLYAGAALATIGGWLAAALDPSGGSAARRAAGRYAIATLLGDLAILAAALTPRGRDDLAGSLLLVAGAVRLLLFPLHGRLAESDRLPARAQLPLLVGGGLVGVGLLARAYVESGDSATATVPAAAGWLLGLGVLTTLSGASLLVRARRYREALDRTWLIETGHLAVAFGLGTPLALVAGLLLAFNGVLARTTLLLVADASSPAGQQRRRLREGPGLIPFGLGFGALTGMPPQPGFVARWILYLALFEAGLGPVALLLAIGAAVAFAVLLTRVAQLDPPARGEPGPAWRPLLLGLGLVWVPLGLIVVAPVVAVGQLIAPALEAMLPGQAWSLEVDRLLGLSGVLGLLLAVAIVLVGFAAYVRPESAPVRRLHQRWRGPGLAPLRRAVELATVRGLPFGLLAGLGELLGQGLGGLLAAGEARFFPVALGAFCLALLLVALG